MLFYCKFVYEVGQKGVRASTSANQLHSIKVRVCNLLLGFGGLSNKPFISLRNAKASDPNKNKSGFC